MRANQIQGYQLDASQVEQVLAGNGGFSLRRPGRTLPMGQKLGREIGETVLVQPHLDMLFCKHGCVTERALSQPTSIVMKKRVLSKISILAAALATAVSAWSQVPLNVFPTRALGHAQLRLSNIQPNLVEGRELNRPQSVAVDLSSGALYVADTLNNRVLGWANANAFDNGAKADVVIGQRDFLSTLASGPVTGSTFSSGLNSPTGLAVDALGNLYVVDSGNNRIIRYPKPFSQQDAVKLADLVIGQPAFSTRGGNQGGLSARSLLTVTTAVFRASITFDGRGDLWVTDAGNNRVLRYPASALGEGASNGPEANLVLGQANFSTNTALALNVNLTGTNPPRLNKSQMRAPSGIAIDQAGRLFVTDNLNRVLVFLPPFGGSGAAATRIIGIPPATPPGQQPIPPINEYTVGVALLSGTTTQVFPAEGVFVGPGNKLFVIDTPANRILRFPAFERWSPESTTAFSPASEAVIGQDAMQTTELRVNRGQAEPGTNTFFGPIAAAYANGETFVVDSENNRILAFGDISEGPRLSSSTPYLARRVLGQIGFEFRAPNLIEGREFNFNSAGSSFAGIAFDARSDPPRLYVADTLNHRVLGFYDARRVKTGEPADVVIGQPDFFRSMVNFPSGSGGTRNNSGLAFPTGVVVDQEGNVWVADTGNGRVLRFPNPFANREQIPLQADIVLGQSNFTSRVTDASARTMLSPYGLALTAEGSLLVSDFGHDRVLMFMPPFETGMAAARVFGQPDFNTIGEGTADNRFNDPRHIAVDSDDRLYVSDSSNNRILIFSRVPAAGPDPRAALILSTGLRNPTSVTVSYQTGEVWVTDTGNNRMVRYPNFDHMIALGATAEASFSSAAPLALALDPYSNLYIADAANRVAVHYPALLAMNAANQLGRVAPGTVTSIRTVASSFRFTDNHASSKDLGSEFPLPFDLGDIQVLVDDLPAPLYLVEPGKLNFLMPNGAPTSGTVEVVVTQPSTGRVVAASSVRMDVAAPGLFTVNETGSGQMLAELADGSANSSSNAVARGEVITLYGTGTGFVPNAPPDGSPVEGMIETPDRPRVIIGGILIEGPENVVFSGLAPGKAGIWRIDVRIPDRVPPNAAHIVVVTLNDIPSNNPQNVRQIVPTIAVR